MLSSYYNRPQFPNQVEMNNYYSYPTQPTETILPFLNNNPRNFVNSSTTSTSTSVSKDLNAPSLQNKGTSKNIPTSVQSKTHFNPHDSVQSLNKKRNDSYLNNISENQLNLPQKKLKAQKSVTYSIFDSLVDGFQVLETHDPSFALEDEYNLSETDRRVNQLEKTYESNSWNSLKHSKKQEAELSQALEFLKGLTRVQKHQNPVDSSYPCKIIFETPFVLERSKEEIPEDPVIASPSPSPSSSSKDQSSDETESLIPTSTSSDPHKAHERSKGLHAIKHSLELIHSGDTERLNPDVYLNDNLINFYLKFIENMLISEEMRKKCHFFNTYFMAQMLKLFNESNKTVQDHDRIYESMKKWVKKVNLFEKDFIFIPVNNNEHWNLIVVCYPARFFSQDNDLPFLLFFDSLSRMDSVYAGILFQFFSRELRAKMPDTFRNYTIAKAYRFNLTIFPHYQHMLPKQSNFSDCGLFLLQYIEMFVYNQDHIMEQKEDMHKMRWFPRKLIQEKRKDIKKIIKDLKDNKIEVIDEYLDKRHQILEKHSKEDHEFDNFNPEDFQQALLKTYPDRVFNEYDQRCLMLDYYFFNTLDYEELSKATKK